MALDSQVVEADVWVQRLSAELDASQRLQKIPNIGPVIALALLAWVGDGRTFANCRSLAA
jgi:transposase